MEEHSIIKEAIERKIYLIHGQKVMVDRDLAELYGVETRVLNQAVRRNLNRFPEDFMFQLSEKELENWISQIVISNSSMKMGIRKTPLVFTEQGIAMLSSVLNSERAIRINIEIMRVFVNIRNYLSTHKELAEKLKKLESKVGVHGEVIKDILEQIRRMIDPPVKSTKRIGFYKEK